MPKGPVFLRYTTVLGAQSFLIVSTTACTTQTTENVTTSSQPETTLSLIYLTYYYIRYRCTPVSLDIKFLKCRCRLTVGWSVNKDTSLFGHCMI